MSRTFELLDRLFCVSLAFYCGICVMGGAHSIYGWISLGLTAVFMITKWICRFVETKK